MQAPSPPPRTSGETPWSTLGAQWVPTPAPRNPVQPGGVALTPTEPCLLRGARGACTRAGTRCGTGTTTVTGRNTLTHQNQAPGCTQPPLSPPGDSPWPRWHPGWGGWLGDTLHWGVGVLPMGAGGGKGGGCHGRGGWSGRLRMGDPWPGRVALAHLWVSLRPRVAVPYLRWLRRRQPPPLPSSGRARPMPLSVQREPTRLGADDAPTPASLEGLRLPGMGTGGAPWKPPQEDTDTCWPPCPRFWPVPVQKRDAERHRCHLGWAGTPHIAPSAAVVLPGPSSIAASHRRPRQRREVGRTQRTRCRWVTPSVTPLPNSRSCPKPLRPVGLPGGSVPWGAGRGPTPCIPGESQQGDTGTAGMLLAPLLPGLAGPGNATCPGWGQ